jgi:hypothetical protein
VRHADGVEIVLRTATPEGIEVVLSALVYAKILEEHAAVRTSRLSTARSACQTSDVPTHDQLVSDSSAARQASKCLPWWSSVKYLRSS